MEDTRAHAAGPVPRLDYLATFTVDVGEPVELGVTDDGKHRIIPILGGTVKGPKLRAGSSRRVPITRSFAARP